MKEKLNLTIEKEVNERAKELAKKSGISVSGMVEQALKSIAGIDDKREPQKGTVV